MIKDIKERLLNDVDILIEFLTRFGFDRVRKVGKYLYMARDDDQESSGKSIVIKLENNEFLKVHDYAKNYTGDIFSFIEEEKGFKFAESIQVAKELLGITDYSYGQKKETKQLFGGFYNKYKKKKEIEVKTYDESILNQYEPYGNKRFERDGISLETQRAFDIGYNVLDQVITIPIRNEFGELMGVKCRANRDVDPGEMKYWYLYPCLITQTLFGYSQNYKYMFEDTIILFESEKSVLQCYDFGFRNAVSMGSSTLSKKQCQLIYSLNPKKIILAHDESLELDTIKSNLQELMDYNRLTDVEIAYWDSTQDIEIMGTKCSLSDLGKERFYYGLENELIYI